MSKTVTNVLIVGVGGQGTLLASRIIGYLAQKKSYDVKVSEVHGMSQRGGSVVTYVKYGKTVASPLIEPGEADLLIAFELLESVRWLDYLAPEGAVAVNNQRVDPMPVITGAAIYPDEKDLFAAIYSVCKDAAICDALGIAAECGSVRSVNIVLLGVIAKKTEFSHDEWVEAIREVTPARALEINLAAFERGYNT